MGIFADGEVGQQQDIATGLGQLVEGGKWDEHIVTNALDLDRGLSRQGLNEFAAKKSDHRAMEFDYAQAKWDAKEEISNQ